MCLKSFAKSLIQALVWILQRLWESVKAILRNISAKPQTIRSHLADMDISRRERSESSAQLSQNWDSDEFRPEFRVFFTDGCADEFIVISTESDASTSVTVRVTV